MIGREIDGGREIVGGAWDRVGVILACMSSRLRIVKIVSFRTCEREINHNQ